MFVVSIVDAVNIRLISCILNNILNSCAMEVRIRFSSEVYISGDSMGEIKAKWEASPLFCPDALEDWFADVVSVDAIEDAETAKDVSTEFSTASEVELDE